MDQFKGKVKSYKKQIEEAEEIAALNLAKYGNVAGAGGDDPFINLKLAFSLFLYQSASLGL